MFTMCGGGGGGACVHVCMHKPVSVMYMNKTPQTDLAFINPRCMCRRVTVLGLCVCVCVCLANSAITPNKKTKKGHHINHALWEIF